MTAPRDPGERPRRASPDDASPDDDPEARDPDAPGLGAVAPDDRSDEPAEPNEPA